MKKYRVTVNGTAYEIELEELTGAAPAPAAATAAPAPAPAPAAPEAAPAAVPVTVAPAQQQEEVAQDIEASMAKIFETPASAPAEGEGSLGDTRVFDQIQFGKDYEIE